jgi:hypothetical protein
MDLCDLVFSKAATAGGASEGAKSEASSANIARRHATHALGRLIDLLQATALLHSNVALSGFLRVDHVLSSVCTPSFPRDVPRSRCGR